jgi:hypothetical protein
MIHAGRPQQAIQVQHHLGIGVAVQRQLLWQVLLAQPRIIIDFAVEADPASLCLHWLMPTGRV